MIRKDSSLGILEFEAKHGLTLIIEVCGEIKIKGKYSDGTPTFGGFNKDESIKTLYRIYFKDCYIIDIKGYFNMENSYICKIEQLPFYNESDSIYNFCEFISNKYVYRTGEYDIDKFNNKFESQFQDNKVPCVIQSKDAIFVGYVTNDIKPQIK